MLHPLFYLDFKLSFYFFSVADGFNIAQVGSAAVLLVLFAANAGSIVFGFANDIVAQLFEDDDVRKNVLLISAYMALVGIFVCILLYLILYFKVIRKLRYSVNDDTARQMKIAVR